MSRLPDFVFEDSQHQYSVNFCLSHRLRTATPQQLNCAIADLASQKKNRCQRPSSFVETEEEVDELMEFTGQFAA